MDHLTLHIESLIFAAEPAITVDEIDNVLIDTFGAQIDRQIIEDAINQLIVKYESGEFAMEIVEVSGGFCFMTKGAFHQTIANHLKQSERKKLSKAALETLAIVAYKQPITKTEIEQIRGVNSDYSIQKLLDKELVEITGRSESVGKPLIYATTEKFVDYFGLKSANDLPKLKEIEPEVNSLGEPNQ